MKEAVRQTRSYLMELFDQHGFHPRSDYGQNFLIDLNIVEFIVRSAELGPNDVVLEVGAGTGSLTAFLARDAGAVVSVEVDSNMYELAGKATGGFGNVTLLNCDALKTKNRFSDSVLEAIDGALAEDPERRLKLVANLPYNVATPVVSNLVATELPWSRMVVTIQLELANRMNARPGRSTYGALSVWLQSQCRVRILRRLSPKVFWPRPQVESAIVQIDPAPAKRKRIDDRAFFHDFVRRVFHHRRKVLRGVVAGMYRKELTKGQVDAILAELELAEGSRAENLAVDELVELANRLRREVLRGEA